MLRSVSLPRRGPVLPRLLGSLLLAASLALPLMASAAGLLDVAYRPLAGKDPVNLPQR